MPIYEYQCEACEHRFSTLLSMSRREEEEKELACPECDAKHARRLMSTFSASVSEGKSRRSAGPPCSGGGG